MITTDQLLAAGYRALRDTYAEQRLGSWYRMSYVKHITDRVGTRYIIFISHGLIPAHNGSPARPFFSTDHQFARKGVIFNVEVVSGADSVEEIETFFETVWSTLRADYYQGGPDQQRQFPQQ